MHNTTVASIGMCNAVELDVRLKADGTILVNGKRENLKGLQAAAMRKDDACPSTTADVTYHFAGAAPNSTKNEVHYWLNRIVQNISLKTAR